MITTIIFDVGGVLVKGSTELFFINASKFLEIDFKKIKVRGEVRKDLGKGEISFQDAIRKIFSVPISDEKMKNLLGMWKDNWKIDTGVFNLAKKIKSNYKVVILSNISKESAEIFINKNNFDFIDPKFRSFELGMIKPNKEIYEHVLKELNVKPEECIFIDDKTENIKGAKNLGINGIVFENLKQLKQDLEKLSVTVE